MNALALCSFIRLINLGEEGRGLPLASAIRARIYCQFPAIFSIRIEQFGANCYGSADSIINPPSLCRRNSPQKFRNNISAVGCRSPNVCPTSSERLKGEDDSISRQHHRRRFVSDDIFEELYLYLSIILESKSWKTSLLKFLSLLISP